ncbi:MAG: DUF1127 domain-containing protein [Pseudomonadota bacterium]
MAAYQIAAPRARRGSMGFSLSGLFSDVLEWRKNRKAAAQLQSMPDYILDDLGLNRADIEKAALYGRR